ncbi:hypothetical protein FB479_106102 [Brevibacillus sp. AG162]|nr:hypothetical protein FB479_106102 [Brevibacillus sp. AG162]
MALMVLLLSMTLHVNWLPTDVTNNNTAHILHIFKVKQNVADPGH